MAIALASCGDSSHAEPADQLGLDTRDDGVNGHGGEDADSGLDTLTCSSDPSLTQTFRLGDWRVDLHEGDGSWSVYRPGDGLEVLSSPPLCGPGSVPLLLAAGSPKVETASGQFRVDLDHRNVKWFQSVNERPQLVSQSRRLALRFNLESDEDEEADQPSHSGSGAQNTERRDTVELVFQLVAGDSLALNLRSDVAGVEGGSISWNCQDDESFFGLGAQSVGLDLRGRIFPLIVQEQGIGKPDDGGIFPLNNSPEASYSPVGALHSSAGWSLLLAHDSYSELDLCSDEVDSLLTLRSFGELPGVVFHPGVTPKERIRSTSLTLGLPGAVPDWVFGVWNDAVGGPDEVRWLATLLRDRRVPSSAIWAEDWIGGELTATGFRLSYRWSWDPDTYPDLPDLISELNLLGFAFLAYFNPFIPETVPTWDTALDSGYLVSDEGGEPITFPDPAFRTSGTVDLYNSEAREWLKSYLRAALTDVGVDGWMADFGEWYPRGAAGHEQASWWAAHNRYPLEWQRAHREVHDEVSLSAAPSSRGTTFFSRSGWGSQLGGGGSLSPILWAGDQNTDWGLDDGLPTVVPIGVHAGLSGATLFGSDIAGYSTLGRDPATTKELFARWTALGALTPIMRTHHGSMKCDNWRLYTDEPTFDHWVRWATIHSLLLPYLQRLQLEAQRQGLPIMRHPWLVEPDARGLWQGRGGYQYFLGDDLLVAPVLAEGQTQREVVLPGTGWWPLFGRQALSAETREGSLGTVSLSSFPVPVGDAAVFVRPGTLLPLLGRAVDTFYGPSMAPYTSLESVEKDLRFALYPDENNILSAQFGDMNVEVSFAVDNDFAGSMVDGVPLPVCQITINDNARSVPAPGCVANSGKWVILRGSGTLGIDGWRLAVYGAPEDSILRFGIGRAAWGDLALASDLGDLDPDPASLTPNCPDE